MSQATIACGKTGKDKATRFDLPFAALFDRYRSVSPREKKKGKKRLDREHVTTWNETRIIVRA